MSLQKMLLPKKILSPWNTKTTFLVLYTLSLYEFLGKITKEKYMGQMSALRKGTLTQKRGTYKCDLNDKWYNDESTSDIWYDLLNNINKPLPVENLIQSIMLYTNKNYNFAINVLYEEYIKPMINDWRPSYNDTGFISEYGLNIDIDEITPTYTSGGWCGCCGSKSYGELDITATQNNVMSKMLDYLHNQKKGNLTKIPKYDGSTPMNTTEIFK